MSALIIIAISFNELPLPPDTSVNITSLRICKVSVIVTSFSIQHPTRTDHKKSNRICSSEGHVQDTQSYKQCTVS